MRLIVSICCGLLLPALASAQALPGTKLLDTKDDLAKVMVDGIHRYLDKQTELAAKERAKYWKADFSSQVAFDKSVQPNRARFRKMIGVIGERLPIAMEKVSTVEHPSLVAQTKHYKIYAVRWPVLPGVFGEGLLLEPTGKPKACAVAIPDADLTPEQLVGVAPGVPKDSQFARRLAEDGYRVIVPTLISRADTYSGVPRIRMTNQPHREFVYRMAYELGRHVIGYEVQKVLSAVDWLAKEKTHPDIEVWGYGEGGLVALYSAAIDPRIKKTHVSGYVNNRNQLHREPIYRNVFGLLKEFGDAELLMLAGAPNNSRTVNVEYSKEPAITGPPAAAKGRNGGAAPGMLNFTEPKDTFAEFERFRKLTSFAGRSATVLEATPFTDLFDPPIDADSQQRWKSRLERVTEPKELRLGFDPQVRQKRQFDEAVQFTQNQLGPAVVKRQASFWSKLNTSSVDALQKSQEPLRASFHEDIIGKLPEAKVPMNPRTRLMYETPKYKAYEVVLDLNEDVICHGILLVPNGIKDGEKRPVVVCQHGLEGRPTDVCNPKIKTQYYNSFGTQLVERGFVVFAPQNPYIFQNHFRQTVRKANPLGLSLYSFIVAQHERILDWLETLSYVDATRIAYYGLSYGGKVAMRIPSIVTRYCLSICSGDFNEWIWKNINLEWQGSYMFTGEYEMYEFDLGNTFNYAEMAALVAPRPFMVERGHSDGVGLDEYVAFEFAKVRRFYAQAGIGDRTEIEWFVGGHVINGQRTFAFLHRHLNWPAPK